METGDVFTMMRGGYPADRSTKILTQREETTEEEKFYHHHSDSSCQCRTREDQKSPFLYQLEPTLYKSRLTLCCLRYRFTLLSWKEDQLVEALVEGPLCRCK